MARTIAVTMSGQRRPAAGNYVAVGTGLHVITAVSGSGPTFTCGIEPGLREDVGAGSAVVFDRPLAVMRQFAALDPGGLTVSGETMATDVTLDLVEAF